MSQLLKRYLHPVWANVPYRDQSPHDSCHAHTLASILYAFFGERGAWEYIWHHTGYNPDTGQRVSPSMHMHWSERHLLDTGCLLESEWEQLRNATPAEIDAAAGKHKLLEIIDLDREPDAATLQQYLDNGYMLYISTGGNLAGRTDPITHDALWDYLDEPGETHAVACGGYEARSDGLWLIYQNSQRRMASDHPQYFAQMPTGCGGLWRVWAIKGPNYNNGGDTMIKPYSLRKDGATKLSANFKVSEFRCKDGSDKILIDDALVAILQRIRDHYGKPVSISSAYRTEAYNKRIGGAARSQHLYGTAADIRIAGVDPRDLARWIEEEINPGGLGLYDYAPGDKSGFVHVDTRQGKSRWVQVKSNGGAQTVGSIIADYLDKGKKDFTDVKLGTKGEAVQELEQLLRAAGHAPVRTEADKPLIDALAAFQRANGLKADGWAGENTWKALRKQ